MNRFLKQIIIALAFFLIVIIVVVGIYLVTKPKLPTCDDGIQNQKETEVDCGGPCSPCSWEIRKDFEVIFTEAVKAKDNYLDLVAKVKNHNQDWGAESFSYTFDLYDSENNLIVSNKGTSYILPLETRYIIRQRVLVEVEISNVEFKMTDIKWQELVEYKEVELLIKNPKFEQTETFSQLTATLENISSYNLDKVDIYVVLFDKESEILGAGKTELRTILTKERRYFEVSWFFPIERKVEKVDATAKTNVFLDDNFMKKYGVE